MRWRRSTPLVLMLMAAASPTFAQDALLREATQFSGEVLRIRTGVPAIVVAAIRGGDVEIAGFGEYADGSGRPPDGRTLMRIGSITKAFTGQMLASLVAEGKVALTDPLALHLEWSVPIPEHSGRAIRLVDLATHAGGLPREAPRSPGPDDDPFSAITRDTFEAWLGTQPLLFAPGSAALYSNFGFDLLSAALAAAEDKPYPDLLVQFITEPLGMSDTTFDPAPEQMERLMQGHGFDGKALPDVPTGDGILGSGGLYSTAEDMVRWLRWHLDRFSRDGAEVRLLTHTSYLPRDGLEAVFGMDESGRMDAVGLGWVVMLPDGDRPLILQKAGGLQGIFCYVAFAPTRGVGAFAAINRFDFSAAITMAEVVNNLIASLAPR